MQNGKRAVLDLGTGCIKAGWAGEGKARYVVPTCAGAVRRRPQLYLSEECYSLQEYICSRPSQGGLWANLEMLRDLLDMCFSRKYLGADPKELSGVALTEPFLSPSSLRHHVSEILFEDLGVERLALVGAQAVVPYAFWGMGFGAQDMCAPPRAKRMGVSCYSGPDKASRRPSKPAAGLPSTGAPGVQGKSKGGGGGAPSAASADPCFSPRLAAAGPPPNAASANQVSPGRNPFGLTVDVGFSACHAVPLVNYSALEGSALRSDIGGAHVNAYLKNLLLTRGVSLEKNELFAQKVADPTHSVLPLVPLEAACCSRQTLSPSHFRLGVCCGVSAAQRGDVFRHHGPHGSPQGPAETAGGPEGHAPRGAPVGGEGDARLLANCEDS